MAKRPILFSGPMVRAILDGRKTQTRRVLNPNAKVRWATDGDHVLDSPYGAPGDTLWVRETCAIEGCGRDGLRVIYHEDREARWQRGGAPFYMPSDYVPKTWYARWRPSIHMPRWASRITLRVTDVRVQRLQDITPTDAVAEGVFHAGTYTTEPGMPYPVATMKSLWDSINAKRAPWSSNPWVWAITFERV